MITAAEARKRTDYYHSAESALHEIQELIEKVVRVGSSYVTYRGPCENLEGLRVRLESYEYVVTPSSDGSGSLRIAW